MRNKTPIIYKISRGILGPLFRIYYNPKIIGKENIPESGRVVIASNHIHVYDQCPIIISTKRPISYMAKKEYFDSIFTRWFFKGSGCISVDRYGDPSDAVKEALDVLDNDGALGIFPEGTRNKTKEFLQPFKFGAVSMAKRTDSYILPVGVTGTYKFRSRDLTIRIGTPFKISDMKLEDANDKLFNEIKTLMEKNLHQ